MCIGPARGILCEPGLPTPQGPTEVARDPGASRGNQAANRPIRMLGSAPDIPGMGILRGRRGKVVAMAAARPGFFKIQYCP